jgi:anthranilate synthase component II
VPAPVVAVLHNLEDPFTGHAGPALRAAGVDLDERFLRAGDRLPALAELDGILSFGGERSVLDIDADPTLTAEATLLREAVGAGVPVLGVCLGHQAIGAALGGRIVRAKVQMHGKASRITTDQQGLYAGLPQVFDVIRYHSLVIERASRPEVFDVTSTSEDDEIMGVRHRELAATPTPLEGVQFHPESILTQHGHAMLKNFLEATR